MSGHILVVGSINMDLVVRTERHPQPGETVLGSKFMTYPGGKGANQAVAAARAGGKVKMIGRIGVDAFGDTLQAGLETNDVDTTCVVRTPGAASGVALITLDNMGQNTIVVAAGANSLLTPADIHDFSPVFEGASVLLLQLEIPLETAAKAMAMAKFYGVKVILNPAPATGLSGSLLAQVDFLVPNQTELALLTGMQVVSLAADALQSLGTGAVIVTLGGEGVLVYKGSENFHLSSHVVPVVDTVAAGDAFVGAFAVAISEGLSLRDAAERGNAAGAISVTRMGAQPSLPTRQEIDAFMQEHKHQR